MEQSKGIIIFDGDCNLCNKAVRFILNRDKKGIFLFTTNESNSAQHIFDSHKLSKNVVDSIVLIQNNKTYTKSTAVLKIAKQLEGPVRFSYVFILVPSIIRDYFYRLISNNRYLLLGKKKNCDMIFSHDQYSKRFL